jgi:hypothetical protein
MVQCVHGGMAMPALPNRRVKVIGQPIVTQPCIYTIADCAFPPPPVANGPCVTAQWVTAAVRVRANGMPVLLQDSQAICTPTGTPLVIAATQTRVTGT